MIVNLRKCMYLCVPKYILSICDFKLWAAAPLIEPYCANNTISNNYSS